MEWICIHCRQIVLAKCTSNDKKITEIKSFDEYPRTKLLDKLINIDTGYKEETIISFEGRDVETVKSFLSAMINEKDYLKHRLCKHEYYIRGDGDEKCLEGHYHPNEEWWIKNVATMKEQMSFVKFISFENHHDKTAKELYDSYIDWYIEKNGKKPYYDLNRFARMLSLYRTE